MNKLAVSPECYRAASLAIKKLKPAIDALQNIDLQTVDDKKAFLKIQEAKEVLIDLHSRHKAIVAQGDRQYESRPHDLINRASHRMINDIPLLIEREEKSLEHLVRAYEFEVEALRKKGFNDEKINKILPPISQAEIDASHARVAALKAEARAIETFLADSPRFNVELLKVTPSYPWPVGEAA